MVIHRRGRCRRMHLMTLLPARPSRPKAMSMPRAPEEHLRARALFSTYPPTVKRRAKANANSRYAAN
jgi:hypothetical protein